MTLLRRLVFAVRLLRLAEGAAVDTTNASILPAAVPSLSATGGGRRADFTTISRRYQTPSSSSSSYDARPDTRSGSSSGSSSSSGPGSTSGSGTASGSASGSGSSSHWDFSFHSGDTSSDSDDSDDDNPTDTIPRIEPPLCAAGTQWLGRICTVTETKDSQAWMDRCWRPSPYLPLPRLPPVVAQHFGIIPLEDTIGKDGHLLEPSRGIVWQNPNKILEQWRAERVNPAWGIFGRVENHEGRCPDKTTCVQTWFSRPMIWCQPDGYKKNFHDHKKFGAQWGVYKYDREDDGGSSSGSGSGGDGGGNPEHHSVQFTINEGMHGASLEAFLTDSEQRHFVRSSTPMEVVLDNQPQPLCTQATDTIACEPNMARDYEKGQKISITFSIPLHTAAVFHYALTSTKG